MTDRRRLPANDRVAAAALKGQVEAPLYVDGTAAQVQVPVVDLRATPGGARDRQLLMGMAVTAFETRKGWSFVQAEDGYVGYIPEAATCTGHVTHKVVTPATHAYAEPNMKSREQLALPHGAALEVVSVEGAWAETPIGFVPARHLAPCDELAKDPVAVALLYLGTPYLWGGNSIWGIDCSGLVQAACRACGMTCPGDSDMQAAELGAPLPDDAPLQRGDVVFWRGHVGMMEDEATLLHANAYAMAVAREDFAAACARIEAQGDGLVTARRRLVSPPRG